MIDVNINLTLNLNITNTNVATLSNQRSFVLRKKHFTFIKEHEHQNIKNFITFDIECCVFDVSTNNNKYVIAEHFPIAVGYKINNNYKYYFGLDYIKRFASDLLETETEKNIKRNEKMVFNEEDKKYHEVNNIFHICSKTCINKVRDHCHETGK